MDRLTEMEIFAAVVDQGGFTDAARKMGLSKSAVSKHVSALEARLGARLLNRTTRRVSPTEIGLAYYDRARRVLNDAGEADALVSAMISEPSGRLRIVAPTDFGANLLTPLIGAFLSQHAAISVSMELTNRFVDIVEEGFDVAIRFSAREAEGLRTRKLTETSFRMVASPGYLDQFGRPERIEDLNNHRLLHYSSDDSANVWRIAVPSGEVREVRTAGWLSVNDGLSLLTAAMAGLGIAYLPGYLCRDGLENGRIVDVMPDLPRDPLDISAVYAAESITSPKIRALVDFLAEGLSGD